MYKKYLELIKDVLNLANSTRNNVYVENASGAGLMRKITDEER